MTHDDVIIVGAAYVILNFNKNKRKTLGSPFITEKDKYNGSYLLDDLGRDDF